MNCIFCGIASREVKSKIVHETGSVLAFEDNNPQAPVHVLVIPKEHITEISGLDKVLPDLFRMLAKIAEEKGIDRTGYRIVMNRGKDAGQGVDHLHFHLLGGRPMHWPPG